ncbi:MAG: hypothetical protein H6813_01310 [Phycisphaeraceae bacterium]|nr:hypothetical protein [Phycisphaeraceae bacterium]MCB9847275.1 hypothetical protein [Phycisphaeraceae bacterium]
MPILMKTPRRLLTLLRVALLLMVIPQAIPTASAQSAAELADTPYHIESIGLTVHLPLGCSVEDTQLGAASKGFRAKARDNTWLLSFSVRSSRDLDLTADGVAESLIEGLLSRRTQRDGRSGKVVGSGSRIISRDRGLLIGDRPADRFYAAVSKIEGGELITGYTIIHTAPGQFAVFQLDTTDGVFEDARAITERAIATARFRDPGAIAVERKAGLDAGESFLAALTPEDYRSALHADPVLYRVYRPAVSGSSSDAEEVAFQFISMREGFRGELDPRKPKARWTAIDEEAGYIVSVHARVLNKPSIIESESIFFLRMDRESEAWAIRMLVKEGDKETGWTETGIREGDDIKVTVDVPASTPIINQWRKPAIGYLSQVEAYLLPALLVNARAIDPMQFYQYQTTGTDIALRSDQLELAPDSQPERPRWTLITKRTEDAEEDRVILDGDGGIVRKELGTGLVVTPIAREDLDRLWRSKGLPPVG